MASRQRQTGYNVKALCLFCTYFLNQHKCIHYKLHRFDFYRNKQSAGILCWKIYLLICFLNLFRKRFISMPLTPLALCSVILLWFRFPHWIVTPIRGFYCKLMFFDYLLYFSSLLFGNNVAVAVAAPDTTNLDVNLCWHYINGFNKIIIPFPSAFFLSRSLSLPVLVFISSSFSCRTAQAGLSHFIRAYD